jgi:hypothetical protein
MDGFFLGLISLFFLVSLGLLTTCAALRPAATRVAQAGETR